MQHGEDGGELLGGGGASGRFGGGVFRALGAGCVFEGAELFEEVGQNAAGGGGLCEFGGWGEDAEGGVFGELFDGVEEGGGVAREIEAGDLETVEKQAGAAGVEVVGGDAFEDEGEGELDAGAVGYLVGRKGEGAEAGLAGGGVFDGAAGGVVVVAERLVAETGRAASAAVGVDVATLVAGGVGWRGEVGGHGGSFWSGKWLVVSGKWWWPPRWFRG